MGERVVEIWDLAPSAAIGRYRARAFGEPEIMFEAYARVVDDRLIGYSIDWTNGNNKKEIVNIPMNPSIIENIDKMLYEVVSNFVNGCDIKDLTRHAKESRLVGKAGD